MTEMNRPACSGLQQCLNRSCMVKGFIEKRKSEKKQVAEKLNGVGDSARAVELAPVIVKEKGL